MKLKEQMLLLESTLSTLSGYGGWVIGKCSFFLSKESESEEKDQTCSLQVIRENSRLAEIGILQGETERLRVMLMRPVENSVKTPKTAGQLSDGNISKSFLVTREETDRYLAASGDKNPIHQGENAIVPGFLMVNRIAKMLENPKKLQVRFFAPLAVGESAELVIRKKDGSGENAEMYRDGERILKIETN